MNYVEIFGGSFKVWINHFLGFSEQLTEYFDLIQEKLLVANLFNFRSFFAGVKILKQ